MTKWEYKIFDIGFYSYHNGAEDYMNDLGKDGWELVCAFKNPNSKVVFKRPIECTKELSEVR